MAAKTAGIDMERNYVTVTLCTGWDKTRGHRLMTTILSNLNGYTIFHWKIP